MMAEIGGVDGCPAGWLLVHQGADGSIRSSVHASAEELFAATGQLSVLAIDIPIGLPDGGSRECDVEARRLVGPRASSVFPTPVRAALAATTYAEACSLSRADCGKAISQQAFQILDRIRDVDEAMRESAALRARVVEVHPEVCFYFMNGAVPLEDAKRSEGGKAMRKRLIAEAFGEGVFETIRTRYHSRQVADDDILDALAALWTARRVEQGQAETIPSSPPADRFRLPMQMKA